MSTVLTIAGFDPSSGAGVTADLMVFAAHGFFGTSCITGLTVQSTLGVRVCYPVDPRIISETLTCLDDDLPPKGIKIGMLGTKYAVAAVCDYIERLRTRGSDIPIVVDPVIRSSSGRELLDLPGQDLLVNRLLPLVSWVTPNVKELVALTSGIGEGGSERRSSETEIVERCETLQSKLSGAGERRLHLVVTFGDSRPPNDFVFTTDGRQEWIQGEHVETLSTHGTGCTFSSALTCRLLAGDDPISAVRAAKRYTTEALRSATPIGSGHGPLNHLWPMR